jgi:hypothetical protein
MSRKTQKLKLEEYILRKSQAKREQERLRYSREYQPEQEGYIPEENLL